MKKLLLALIALAFIFFIAVWQRHTLIIQAMSTGEPPPLLEQTEEPGAIWFDDYFTVQQLDSRTYAIGEPRYLQKNFSYLILGDTRAILFDAGPGVRDIRPVVESLTTLPLTFVPSHFHYDHIGNDTTFTHVAVLDVPHIRSRAPDNRLALTWQEHLGQAEGIAIPTLEVDVWLQPNEIIELGDRQVQVLYTPGHTTDSISLLDVNSGDLFSGDYLYPGPLFAFLPNSSMGDYQQATDTVLQSSAQRLLGAHRSSNTGVPELDRSDVLDLRTALQNIRAGTLSGSGIYPSSYAVNERLELMAEPGWLQEWQATYPELSPH